MDLFSSDVCCSRVGCLFGFAHCQVLPSQATSPLGQDSVLLSAASWHQGQWPACRGLRCFLNERTNKQMNNWTNDKANGHWLTDSQSRGSLWDLNRIEDYELEFDGNNYRDISFLCWSQCKNGTRVKFLEWIYCWFHRWPIPHLSPDAALCN